MALGQQKRSKAELLKSITAKLQKVDNLEALEILAKIMDKPNIDRKLVSNRFIILNF